MDSTSTFSPVMHFLTASNLKWFTDSYDALQDTAVVTQHTVSSTNRDLLFTEEHLKQTHVNNK